MRSFWRRLGGALTFYTVLPLPPSLLVDFNGIAAFAPGIGLIIGGCLGLVDLLGMAPLTSASLMVGLWLVITGGLHMDGVIDSGDGLAVTDSDRRLEVMADSKTGAYGVMASAIVILFKTTALTDLITHVNFLELELILMLSCGWGRWGQLLCIYLYPYLRVDGKGAFHKTALNGWQSLLPATLLLISLTIIQIYFSPRHWGFAIVVGLLGLAIACGVGAWFNYRFAGQTGDTYGAVVEWTEALLLMGCCIVINNFS